MSYSIKALTDSYARREQLERARMAHEDNLSALNVNLDETLARCIQKEKTKKFLDIYNILSLCHNGIKNSEFLHSLKQECINLGIYSSGLPANTILKSSYSSVKHLVVGRHFDVYSKWAQSTVLHTYMLSRAKSFTDVTLIVLAFLDANTDGPLLSLDRSQFMMSKAKKICEMFVSRQDFVENGMVQQGLFEDFKNIENPLNMETFKKGLENTKRAIKRYECFKVSKLYKRIYKLCSYLMCVSVCDKFGIKMSDWGYSALEEKMMKKNFHLSPDFLVCLVDTLIFVCETGVQCFTTGSCEPIFHSGDNYLAWYEKTLDIQRTRLTISSADNSAALPNFLGDLDEVIEKGESIFKYATSATEKKTILSSLNSMKIIRDEMISTATASTMRQAPFSILLYGDSGIGKSSILNLLYQHFAKIRGLNSDDKFRYTINPVAKFWDNFQTYQWAIVLDDIAALRPDKCSELEPSLAQVLMVNNIIPYTPDQAALEKKGKTPLRAKFVIATTNTKNLNALSFFNCPSAIQRRFPYIVTPTVKKQYTIDGRLDSSMCTDVVDYPDFWTWKVEKVITRSVVNRGSGESKNCFYETVLEDVDLATFLRWFNSVTESHFQDQELTTSNNNMVKDVSLCICCKLPPSCCRLIKTANDIKARALATRPTRLVGGKKIISPTGGLTIIDSDYDDYIKKTYNLSPTFMEMGNDSDTSSVASLGIDISGMTEQGFKEFCQRQGPIMNSWLWPAFEWMWIHQDGIAIFFCLWAVYACKNIIWMLVFIYVFFRLNFIQYDKIVGNFSLPRRIYRKYIQYKVEAPDCSVEDLKKFYKQMGDNVAQNMGYPMVLLGITSIIGSVLVLRKIFGGNHVEYHDHYNYEGAVMSGDEPEIGVKPSPSGEEKENPWKKEEFSLTSYDVSPESCSWKALNKEKLQSIIKNNLVRFIMKGDNDEMRATNAFCITQQIYVFNRHTFEGWEKAVVLISATEDMTGVGDKLKVRLDRKMFLEVPERDLIFVHIANMPPRKDLTKYFCKASNKVSAHGFYIGRDGDFKLQINNARYISVQKVNKLAFKNEECWVGHVETPTADGFCGSLLVLTTHFGPVFAGIHAMGSPQASFATARITHELLQDVVMPHFAERLQCGEPKLCAPSKERILADIHDKATVRFIENGSAATFGSFSDRAVMKKSMVGPTPFFRELKECGFEDKYTKPMLKGWLPQRNALLELTDTATTFDPVILEHAYDGFLADLTRLLPVSEIRLLEVYDTFTAVNGAAGVAYVDKINRNTSMGCPWKTIKRKFMVDIDPQFGLQEPVEFTEEVMARVESMRINYITGDRCQPVFCANLKDEAVSYEKARLGKTRVFMGAPADFTVLIRQYFLSCVRVIQRNRFAFEAAPGTNACSKEWDDIYQYLVKHGTDRMVAGDFKKFDKRMPANFMLAAFDILINLCKYSGNFSADDLRVMKGIAYDISFPVCDYFGTLMMFFGSNPSGHPLTVIINCLVNSLYMRYCYLVCNPREECYTFKHNVSLITYGDDNVMGVSVRTPWFSHSTIQSTLKQCGVDYTMADKSEGSIPYLNIKDVSFLKRYWRMIPEVPFMVAPLELSSIEKSLMTWTRSKSITPEQQMIAVLDSAMQSFALCGKVRYDLMKSLLYDLCCTHKYDKDHDLTKIFPDYDFMIKKIFGDCTQTRVELSVENQNLIPLDSDCKDANIVPLQDIFENGYSGEIRQGVPLSAYLGKITSQADTCLVEELNPYEMDLSWDDINWSAQVLNTNTAPAGLGAKTESNPEGLVDAMNSTTVAVNQTETVQYSDEVAGKMVMFNPISDSTFYSSYTPSADIARFFERPVAITSISWTEAATLNGSFDPWHLYFNNTAVKSKLNNFTFMSCNLRVKLVINASPFYYGFAMFSYIPLYKYYGTTTLDFGSGLTGPPAAVAIPLSQMPHVNVYPQNCQGGEMVLPFFYPRDWINVTTAANLTNMGTIYYYSPVALNNANSVSGESATIQVLAWAENVKLFGPTGDASMQGSVMDNPAEFDNLALLFADPEDIDFVPYYNHWESDSDCESEDEMPNLATILLASAILDDLNNAKMQVDEYSTGPISSIASAIARATGALGKVPVIGKYMTATSFLAGTAASVARWFGYTNPPVISDVMPMRPTPFGGFANTDISFPLEKLTLDPKNELSIDPTITGLGSIDEMAISNIVCRESILTTCEWDADEAVDGILFSAKVTPQHWQQYDQVAGSSEYFCRFGTPSAHLSRCFYSWRGDLIYRFRFIMSKFHKGRARITWDPNDDICTAATGLNVGFNKIVDISSESDIEVRVPYMQATPYLRLGLYADDVTFRANSATAYTHDSAVDNGTITLRVFTKQTSPVLESDVFVVISVRCADNFEFANPSDNVIDFSYFQPQSLQVTQYDNPEHFDMSMDSPPVDERISLICNGETVLSTRQLLRRTCYVRDVVFDLSADDTLVQFQVLRSYLGRFPRAYGHVSTGVDLSAKEVTPGTDTASNYDKITPFSVIVPMFRAMRGSMNMHINYEGLRTAKRVKIVRLSNETHTAAKFVVETDVLTTATRYEMANELIDYEYAGTGGSIVTNQLTQAGVSAVLPMYSIYRFISAAPRTWGPGASADSTDLDCVVVSALVRPNDEPSKTRSYSLYSSVGADFGLHFFLCVPVVYQYTAGPPN